MPSNPYMKASGAYRSAIQTLPPVRGVAALLERCQLHTAAASRHAAAGAFEAYATEIGAAINILTGLSLYFRAYLSPGQADEWDRMLGGLIIALGRAAARGDVAARILACHERVAGLRHLWARLAGLDVRREDPVYKAPGSRPSLLMGA